MRKGSGNGFSLEIREGLWPFGSRCSGRSEAIPDYAMFGKDKRERDEQTKVPLFGPLRGRGEACEEGSKYNRGQQVVHGPLVGVWSWPTRAVADRHRYRRERIYFLGGRIDLPSFGAGTELLQRRRFGGLLPGSMDGGMEPTWNQQADGLIST